MSDRKQDAETELVRLLGDQAFDALEPVSPPAALRARLLERVQGPERFFPFLDIVSRVFDLPTSVVSDLFHRASDPANWTPGIVPVRRYLDFTPGPRAAAPRAGLVTFAAGHQVPAHRHEEPEVMVVLAGELSDDRGRSAGPGECLQSDPGSTHRVDFTGTQDAVIALGHGRIHLLGV